jgi:hypothetical protein
MPCPYFHPTAELGWPNAPRLPLGDAYTGLCQADPAAEIGPEPAILRDLCNLGYARGRCVRFPSGAGPDAVRFSVVSDDAAVVRICWVRERDHHPFDHGWLDYSREVGTFDGAITAESLLPQAQAYVASYLRRKAGERRKS